MTAPRLQFPVIVRCGTCLATIRDECSTPDAPHGLRLQDCAACRVARQRPEDEFGPARQDESEPCEATCCEEER